MPRYFARKFQALSLVVLLVAVFGVMAAFPMPAAAQSPVPLTKQPLVPNTAAPDGYGFTLTVNSTGVLATSTVQWQEKVLHNFGSGTDGVYPQAGLIFDVSGNLYGTSSAGGTYGSGTVFELSPIQAGGWAETVLYSFRYGTDGAYPQAGLILDTSGNLYGTTPYGGTSNCGTVFELSPMGGGAWTETVLHNFNCTDGYFPTAGLIFDAAGNLYGTTLAGGTYFCPGGDGYGCGTAFELTRMADGSWTEIVLHDFGNGSDGAYPGGGLALDAAGNLYGTTTYGGTNDCPVAQFQGCGTVFELTPTGGGGWTEMVLHNFGSGTDGEIPLFGVIFDVAGNLYGTTIEGGAYHYWGNLFELSPTGGGNWTETVLYNFTSGYEAPYAPLTFDAAGNLYSTTGGAVIELSSAGGGGWTYTVLSSFCSENGCTDGSDPLGGLIFDAGGNLYGTTAQGGTYLCGEPPNQTGCGTVFELTPVYPCATCSQSAFRETDVLRAGRRNVFDENAAPQP